MKRRLILSLCTLLSGFVPSGRANLILDTTDIIVPLTFDGVYLNIPGGAVTNSFPATWSTLPWINPFFGGVYVATSALLQPVIEGADQIVNLAPGTIIGPSSTFAAGESGSSTHVGPSVAQFQIGVPGLMGFKFQTSAGGPDHYGWLGIEVNNTGAGTITGFAYEDTPDTAVLAGSLTAIPEPAEALLVVALALPCVTLCLRLRRRRRACHS